MIRVDKITGEIRYLRKIKGVWGWYLKEELRGLK